MSCKEKRVECMAFSSDMTVLPIVGTNHIIHNTEKNQTCEVNGKVKHSVIHAEIDMLTKLTFKPVAFYVNLFPCINCVVALNLSYPNITLNGYDLSDLYDDYLTMDKSEFMRGCYV